MAQTPDTFDIRTGDGTSTLFSFDFPYLQQADVYVEVDEVPVSFVFSTGNTVELSEAPALGASVYLYRDTPAATTAYDFQLGAPFLPAFIDENFSQLLYAVQEGIDRTAEVERQSLRVPENTGTTFIPAVADRANKVLAFDANGDPVTVTASTDSAAALAVRLAGNPANGLGAALVNGAVIQASSASSSTLTFNIPTDYATLQLAVDDLSSKYTAGNGITIDLVIESGHALTDGVLVSNGDYGHFSISSVDAVVLLDNSFPSNRDICHAEYARAPVLSCLVDMAGQGHYGYVLKSLSSGTVSQGCGIIGADVNLLVFEGSSVNAPSTIFKNAIKQDWGRNVWVSNTSRADLQIASGGLPTDASGAEGRCIYVSRTSLLNFHDGNCSGSQTDINLYVIRSIANCQNADLRNAFTSGLFASSASVVNAVDTDTSNAGKFGYWANGNSTLNAARGTANDCTEEGVISQDSSTLVFSQGTALNSGTYGGSAKFGGHLNVQAASLSGALGATSVANGGVIFDGSAFNFGAPLEESGVPIFDLSTSSGTVLITKNSDGSMSQLYQYLEVTADTTNRLLGSLTFTEAFVSRPNVTITKLYSSFAALPTSATYFNEFTGGGGGFGLIVRNIDSASLTLYVTDESQGITTGENGYVQVEVKGRWK